MVERRARRDGTMVVMAPHSVRSVSLTSHPLTSMRSMTSRTRSCTVDPTFRSCVALRTPNNSPRPPLLSDYEGSHSRIATVCTAWCVLPRRLARSGCPRCSERRSAVTRETWWCSPVLPAATGICLRRSVRGSWRARRERLGSTSLGSANFVQTNGGGSRVGRVAYLPRHCIVMGRPLPNVDCDN